MIEPLLIHWKSVLKIFLIGLVNVLIYVYLFKKILTGYLHDNWTYFRNKPYILPISGFIKPIKGKSGIQSTVYNFISFLWNIVKKFLELLMTPLYRVFNIVTKILGFFRSILDKFRIQFKIMRNFLFKIVEKVYMRLQNTVATMTYFFLKLREGIKRQLGLFKMLSWTIAHSYYFLRSLMDGPVGDFAKIGADIGQAMAAFTLGGAGLSIWQDSVCFDPDTRIKLLNGEYKNINKIKLEDILIDGSIVKGYCEFNISSQIVSMYIINDVIVSGDHIIYEEGKTIRVCDSKLSKPYYYDKENLICLITNTGKIPINNMIFSDYLDTHDLEVNRDIQIIVENKLNKNLNYSKKRRLDDLVWGFSNFSNQINKYNIGSYNNGNKILGKIIISKDFITPYKYRCNNGKIILVSGNVLVKENTNWIRISQSKKAIKYNDLISEYYVHYITENNQLYINDSEFTDFMETSDNVTNSLIDHLVDIHHS